MRIFVLRTIKRMYQKHPDSKTELIRWVQIIRAYEFKTCQELQHYFKDAECIGSGRVVFNICVTRYRLVAHCNYQTNCIYICFIGTHKEYDKINAKTVNMF